MFRVRSRNKASELRMGWLTFSTTEETTLPKIKSEDDADSVFFLTAKALCTKSSCKQVALFMQNITKVC